MALENPLPPRQFRDAPIISSNLRRSIRASSDGVLLAGDESEDRFPKIDMKNIVPAGKMSISPSNRDVVMASRAGLYILDLENPRNVPAFLPQGGMLEMADIQWNPHVNWSEYILSTSGEKLLVWNLKLGSNRHIQHTLEVHYRAITDINWHTSDPSRIATCAIDAWVWLWDLRSPAPATNRLGPSMGLCAFNESATQVKWNHRNPYILASAHNNEVLIWDERKGSIPLNTIRAHDSKIYGINWSRFSESEITTCSLDKSIKTWNAFADGETAEPTRTIRTSYPVWRARNLPFGRGILAQPHRGRHALDMYNAENSDEPIHSFEGFTDVVSEFVWRMRGSGDDKEFQLITWDKDSVLRYWPVDEAIMRTVGYNPNAPTDPDNVVGIQRGSAPDFSYRDLLESEDHLTRAITAPTHQSGVLRSVKALKTRRGHRSGTESSMPAIGPSLSPVQHLKRPPNSQHSAFPSEASNKPVVVATMGKGHGRAARPQVDPQAWYSAVEKEEELKRRRSLSNDTGSSVQRSESRARMKPEQSVVRRGREGRRSESIAKEAVEVPRTLKEEINQAVSKFASSELQIVDITITPTSRKCTVEVHGRPGLLIRVIFSFPSDYPNPNGGRSPTVDIEHVRRIAPRKRANMLRELRKICSGNPLCLEPCIRFLLGLPSTEGGSGRIKKPFSLEESDSEEEEVQVDEVPDTETGGAAKLQANQPPRERTAQAVFSMNGMLVRIVTSDRPRPTSPSRRNTTSSGKTGHLGDLPLALRGLEQMARELPNLGDGDLVTEENGYSFADSFSTQPGVKHTGILGPMWNRDLPFKPRAKAKGNILIEGFPRPDPDAFDPILASKFIYTKDDPEAFCLLNAVAAARHGRHDYRRILESLAALLRLPALHSSLWDREGGLFGEEGTFKGGAVSNGIRKIYQNLVARRNLQMLAMFSIALLLSDKANQAKQDQPLEPTLSPTYSSDGQRTKLSSSIDYFSFLPRREQPSRPTIMSPAASTPPPEIETTPASTPPQHSSFGTIASRAGAISSMLYLFTGASEGSDHSHKHRNSDPPTPSSLEPPVPIPIPQQRGGFLRSTARSPRPRRGKSDASAPTPTPTGSVPSTSGPAGGGSLSRLSGPGRPGKKPTSVFVPTPGTMSKTTITFALAGQPRIHLTSAIPQERGKRLGPIPAPSAQLVLENNDFERPSTKMPNSVRTQLIFHIRFYAELLFRAGLREPRNEVLRITGELPLELQVSQLERNHLTIHHLCRSCSTVEVDPDERIHLCIKCRSSFLYPACSFCRLPVKGLSRTCLSCTHTTHLKCWSLRQSKACSTGCGCECPNNASFNVATLSVRTATVSPTSPTSYQ